MKWTFGSGRPRVMRTIEELVMRMASENPRWGYTRIQGALSNLGHKVARGTVSNILKREGIDPAPTRGKRTPWYVLFFIDLPTRAVTIAGITTNPTEAWMLQIARNTCDVDETVLSDGGKLLVDRDTKYSGDWRRFIEEQGMEVIRLPPKSPNRNAYAERFVRSIKDECLNRMIFIGEASCGAPCVNSWRITTPRGIIRAWIISLSAPGARALHRMAR